MISGIHQEVSLNASPTDVYNALLDAALFTRMSGGAEAEIDPAPGGAFSCFGGMITGRNIECEPARRIVQAWRVKNWDSGVYSIVRFDFEPEDGGTRVVLHHAAFPSEHQSHLEQGWHRNYWNPLQKLWP